MDSPDSTEYPELEAMTPVKKMLFLESLVCLDLRELALDSTLAS